jgi:hypothetical protein
LREYIEWITTFWAKRGLKRPNGEMLFSYRATKAEYLSLRAVLAHKLDSLNGQPWTFDSTAESACFVLYASEWWRREYAGGPWRWTHILASIWPVYNLDVFERTHSVERGLKAWGHRVGDAGKKYLGSIVAQGGLPLQMVAQGDGSITRLLVGGLRQAQLYAWDSIRLEAFFAAHESELVQHLRDKEIYRLLMSIVQTVLALRQECQLAGVSNPVEVLDRQQPNWRERFPISVDDGSAEPLLIGLVREAAREVKAVTSFPVVATRSMHLRSDGETYELVMALEMSSHLSLDALATACDMAMGLIPQAFSLELHGLERVSLGEGRQLLGGNEPTVMLSGRSKRVLGNAAMHEQMLVMRGLSVDLHEPVCIPGAEALDADQPWIFALKDVGVVLAGVGSIRLPEDQCLIAVKDGQEVLPVEASSDVVFKGTLTNLGDERQVYELRGSAKVQAEVGYFLIQTGQTSGLSEQLVWHGRRAPYGARPLPVYQGVPHLCRLTAEGGLLSVPPQEIHWVEPVKNGARIEQLKSYRGPVDAWLMRDGVRQRRFRMVLVSQDARIRFQSGESSKQGVIEFHGWGVESLAGPEALTTSVDVQSAVARLAVCAADRPPANVTVSVAWPHSALTQRLDLPFPSTGGRFVGQNGGELASGSSMSLRQLQSIRLQVFDRNPDAPRKYTLSIELKSTRGHSGHLRVVHNIAIDMQGVGELRLMEIESSLLGLMCQSNELDARLQLKLNIGQSMVSQLFLNRYDAELEPRELEMAISDNFLASLHAEALVGIRLRALPLLKANAQEVELVQSDSCGVPVGRWNVATLSVDQGPWLVYPAAESSLQLRPTLYVRPSVDQLPTELSQLCALGQAMSAVNQSDRLDHIQDVVAEMAANFDHPSWLLISQQCQLLSHLPLSTFDYWRVISKDLSASLSVVLKVSSDVPALMKRMCDELGVVWELMPRGCLEAGLQLYLQAWAHQLKTIPSDPLVRTVCEPMFRLLAQADSVLGDMVELVLFQAGFERTERLTRLIGAFGSGPLTLLSQLWQGENSLLQRFLLRTHIEDRVWPHFDLWLGLVESLQELAPENIGRQLPALAKDLLWQTMAGKPGSPAKDLRADVANVPLLAGLLSQCTPSTTWWKSSNRLAELRQIRNFDPGWFQAAFRTGVLLALALEQTGPVGHQDQAKSVEKQTSMPVRFRRTPAAISQ